MRVRRSGVKGAAASDDERQGRGLRRSEGQSLLGLDGRCDT